MSRGFLLKNNLTKDTLLKIALLGLIVVAASTSPRFLNEISYKYFTDKTKDLANKRIKKLRELQKKNLLEFKELSNGDIKIILSHRGEKLVRQYKLEEMKIKKPTRWDRKWRLIIYDIPIAQRRASNAFREKLRDLGLFQLQRSVWVSPYECLPEIEFLCSVFNIDMDKYVYYFKTTEIPREGEIRKLFGL